MFEYIVKYLAELIVEDELLGYSGAVWGKACNVKFYVRVIRHIGCPALFKLGHDSVYVSVGFGHNGFI